MVRSIKGGKKEDLVGQGKKLRRADFDVGVGEEAGGAMLERMTLLEMWERGGHRCAGGEAGVEEENEDSRLQENETDV